MNWGISMVFLEDSSNLESDVTYVALKQFILENWVIKNLWIGSKMQTCEDTSLQNILGNF